MTPVELSESPVLRHLVDLYAYDFSELLGLDVGEDGRFPFRDLAPYWEDPWRHPRFIRVEGKLAGFALLHTRGYFDADPSVNDVAEFFVLRKYRRQGVGERAAVFAFRSFPGSWQVRERRENAAAIAFWRRVIARYSGGEYEEIERDDDRWRGPVQRFTR